MSASCKIRKWNFVLTIGLLLAAIMALSVSDAGADDWPTFRHDNRRSGITREKLTLPLKQSWTITMPTPPQTAWAGPAPWDSYANLIGLAAMRDFDSAFFVTIVEDVVFFGSSIDDSVYCLDSRTGKEKWSFVAEGPVRLPPTVFDGKCYFGSDDGCAYCVGALRGNLLWKYKPSEDDRLIASNGKMISVFPVRTDVLVQDGIAYFAASLLPWRESYLCALDAQTGSDSGDGLYKVSQTGQTLQGAVLASPTKLYVSQGRQHPVVYDRNNGKLLGTFGGGGDGGIYALLTPDNTFIHGRGQNHRVQGELRAFDAEKRDYIVTFPLATRMVASEKMAYLHTEKEVSAFDREQYLKLQQKKNQLVNRQSQLGKKLKDLGDKADSTEGQQLKNQLDNVKNDIAEIVEQLPSCTLWKIPSPYYHSMILAGDTLFVGGENEIAAVDITNGKILWTQKIRGKAFGLAAANGHLYVSTDTGVIHCFETSSQAKAN
ncbi:MAG: PQQ-binding-like beta-propeller repeat protein [Sedimentisphaerales bacterium]|nr:PQQ-binding-like beta-propeller repeat protein [Sedimentisphaerales bacterium]